MSFPVQVNHVNVFFLLMSVKKVRFFLIHILHEHLFFCFLALTLVQCLYSACCFSWKSAEALMKEVCAFCTHPYRHPQRKPRTHALGHNSFTHRMLCLRRAGHTALGLAASASGDILRNRLAAISQSQVSWKRKS